MPTKILSLYFHIVKVNCVHSRVVTVMLFLGKSRSPPQLEQLSKKLQSMSYSRDDTDVHDGPVSPPKKFTTVVSPSLSVYMYVLS